MHPPLLLSVDVRKFYAIFYCSIFLGTSKGFSPSFEPHIFPYTTKELYHPRRHQLVLRPKGPPRILLWRQAILQLRGRARIQLPVPPRLPHLRLLLLVVYETTHALTVTSAAPTSYARLPRTATRSAYQLGVFRERVGRNKE